MHANQPYDPESLIRFQVSLLSLGVALERSAPIGVKDISTGAALVQAEQLQSLIEPRDG